MKIVVLAAGTSPEREVSIVSGTGVCQALQSLGHAAILVDVFFGCPDADPETVFTQPFDVEAAAATMHAQTSQIEETAASRRDFFGPQVLALCQAADFVFLALHGANGEDGRVQATLDLFGVPYSGADYISSALAMDKTRTKQLFEACGIPTPRGCTLVRGQADVDSILSEMELPLIVKPPCGGSSIGVTICQSREELQQGLTTAFTLEEAALVEEYIAGKELTAAVLGGKAYPVVEIIPKDGFYDYKNKYQPGMTEEICPAHLSEEKTEELQAIAVQAAEALGISTYVRFDFLMRESDGKLFCLEGNTLPGMTPTSLVPREAAALGMSYADLCQELVNLSLKKQKQTL